MAEEVFQPYESVPEAGIYQVLHYRHRLPHEAILLWGGAFPTCSECGSNVRYRLVRTARLLEEDRNFTSPAENSAVISAERNDNA